MKKNIYMDLPKDCCQACDIFGFLPEEVIQEFVRRVSLPRYFRNPRDRHRWANLFFLDYLDNLRPTPVMQSDVHEKYSDMLTEKAAGADSNHTREQVQREVMHKRQRAISRERTPQSRGHTQGRASWREQEGRYR